MDYRTAYFDIYFYSVQYIRDVLSDNVSGFKIHAKYNPFKMGIDNHTLLHNNFIILFSLKHNLFKQETTPPPMFVDCGLSALQQ